MNRGIITICEDGAVDFPTATVWMTQEEIADMLDAFGSDVRKAIKAIYKEGILSEFETMRYVRHDERISMDVYNLEIIIGIAYRIRSKASIVFRRYVTGKLYPRNDCQVLFFMSEARKDGSIFN